MTLVFNVSMSCPGSLPQGWRQSKKPSANFYHVQPKGFGTRKFERRANQEDKSVVGKWMPVVIGRLSLYLTQRCYSLHLKKDHFESIFAGEHSV